MFFFFFSPLLLPLFFHGRKHANQGGEEKNESEVNRVHRLLSGTSVREKQTVETETGKPRIG